MLTYNPTTAEYEVQVVEAPGREDMLSYMLAELGQVLNATMIEASREQGELAFDLACDLGQMRELYDGLMAKLNARHGADELPAGIAAVLPADWASEEDIEAEWPSYELVSEAKARSRGWHVSRLDLSATGASHFAGAASEEEYRMVWHNQ